MNKRCIRFFYSSTRKNDSKMMRKTIFFYNQFLLFTSIIFFCFSLFFLIQHKIHFFFYILAISSVLLIISIFRRTKLKKIPVLCFFLALTVMIYLSLITFGPLTGNGFLYSCVLTAFPVFFSWKHDKKYYLMICVALFLGIVMPFFYVPAIDLVDPVHIKTTNFSDVNYLSMGIGMLFCVNNFYYIYKISAVKKEKVRNNNYIMKEEQLITLPEKDDPLLTYKFKQLHPVFTDKIMARNPDLTSTEFKFCVLIYHHMSSKEMADYLNLTYRTIQTKKNKLRRKLNLEEGADLYEYMKMIEEEKITEEVQILSNALDK